MFVIQGNGGCTEHRHPRDFTSQRTQSPKYCQVRLQCYNLILLQESRVLLSVGF